MVLLKYEFLLININFMDFKKISGKLFVIHLLFFLFLVGLVVVCYFMEDNKELLPPPSVEIQDVNIDTSVSDEPVNVNDVTFLKQDGGEIRKYLAQVKDISLEQLENINQRITQMLEQRKMLCDQYLPESFYSCEQSEDDIREFLWSTFGVSLNKDLIVPEDSVLLSFVEVERGFCPGSASTGCPTPAIYNFISNVTKLTDQLEDQSIGWDDVKALLFSEENYHLGLVMFSGGDGLMDAVDISNQMTEKLTSNDEITKSFVVIEPFEVGYFDWENKRSLGEFYEGNYILMKSNYQYKYPSDVLTRGNENQTTDSEKISQTRKSFYILKKVDDSYGLDFWFQTAIAYQFNSSSVVFEGVVEDKFILGVECVSLGQRESLNFKDVCLSNKIIFANVGGNSLGSEVLFDGGKYSELWYPIGFSVNSEKQELVLLGKVVRNGDFESAVIKNLIIPKKIETLAYGQVSLSYPFDDFLIGRLGDEMSFSGWSDLIWYFGIR